MSDITRIREAAGCTRMCSLSDDYRLLTMTSRYTHNGVRFSHQTDVDDQFKKQHPEAMVEILSRWCQEHHAGRDGSSITIERDGCTQTVLIPEVVG